MSRRGGGGGGGWLNSGVRCWAGMLQVAEPKKAPKGRKGRRTAVAEAEAADVHAEEIELIDDDDDSADGTLSQVGVLAS